MSSSPHPVNPSVALPSVRGLLSVRALLVAVVVGTGIARLAVAFERRSPRYLPDEFLYSQLARSLGHGDGVTVLGQPSPFPALLEPLSTAAFWLTGNPELAYRLTQSLHAVAVSAAAIPIYLIARQLGLPQPSAFIAVVLGAVAPGLVYASYLTADALGYLLALSTIAVGIRMLADGSRVSQCMFLALAVASVFARVQYVVLIPAVLIAALVVDRGRIGQTGRRLPIFGGAVALAGIAAIATGPSLLGRYRAVASYGLSWETGRWFAVTLLLLTIATGVVVVPGAVAWIGSTLLRPRDRARTAFAAFLFAFTIGLIVASSVMSQETGSQRFFERYLFVLMPLLGLAFLCWLEDRQKGRWVVVAIGTAMIALIALVPLSSYAEGEGRADSPTLQAVSLLSDSIGIGSASLVAALVITAASTVGVLAAVWHRVPRSVVIGTALVLLAGVSIEAHAGEVRGSQALEKGYFLGDPRWVDSAGAEDVMLVQTAYSGSIPAMITSFWNTSVTSVNRLGDRHIESLDGMSDPIRVSAEGALVNANGSTITRPILFATGGTAAAFSDTVHVAKDRAFALVLPGHGVRLAGLAEGVRSDGTLAPQGKFVAYPTREGRCATVAVRLALPRDAPTATLRLRQGGKTRLVRVRPGGTRTISVTSDATEGRSISYDGWVGTATSGPMYVPSIALARFAASTSRCGEG